MVNHKECERFSLIAADLCTDGIIFLQTFSMRGKSGKTLTYHRRVKSRRLVERPGLVGQDRVTCRFQNPDTLSGRIDRQAGRGGAAGVRAATAGL